MMIFAVILGISQTSYAQKEKALTKDEAIKRLTELVIEPFDEKEVLENELKVEKELLKPETEEEIKEQNELLEIRRKEDVFFFSKILAENKRLTDDQKAFIKTNHNEVSDLVNETLVKKRLARSVRQQKELNDLIVAGFQKSLATDFGAAELNSLVIFFESAKAKKVIKSFAWKLGEMLMPMPDDMKAELSDEDKEAIKQYSEPFEEFSKTPNGKKFANSLMIDGYKVAYDQHFKEIRELLEKISEMEDDEDVDPDKLPESLKDDELTTDEINEVFEKYIAKNYDASSNPQKSDDISTKQEAVKKLTALSYPMQIYASPKYVLREELLTAAALREMFDKVLKDSNDFTSEEKKFLKENYEELLKIVKKEFYDIAESDNKLRVKFAIESFEKSVAENLTLKEINELLSFFQSSEGERTLKLLYPPQEDVAARNTLDENDPKLKELQEKLKKFEESPVGKKYYKILSAEPTIYAEEKLEQETKTRGGALIPRAYSSYIEKILDKYVAEKQQPTNKNKK